MVMKAPPTEEEIHFQCGQIEKVRNLFAAAGSDPVRFDVTAYSAKTAEVEPLSEAGVDRAVFSLPPSGEETIQKLDDWAEEWGIS